LHVINFSSVIVALYSTLLVLAHLVTDDVIT
jgi:hypothetical protein